MISQEITEISRIDTVWKIYEIHVITDVCGGREGGGVIKK